MEGREKVTDRQGRRRKQLPDNLKKKRLYWNLKEEELDRTACRTGFWKGLRTSRKVGYLMVMTYGITLGLSCDIL